MRGDTPGLRALFGAPAARPRRLRGSEAIRELVRETELPPGRLVMPLFRIGGEGKREAIDAMPGRQRLSIDEAMREIEAAWALGIKAVALFPRIDDAKKTPDGEEALREDTLGC